jgi:hypothetical protein
MIEMIACSIYGIVCFRSKSNKAVLTHTLGYYVINIMIT